MSINRCVIENPASGETIVVVQTAAETGGELFSFELFLRPGGRVPAAHVHPAQRERFTVLEGKVRFRLGIRSHTAGIGDSLTVTPGTSHSFVNAGTERAHLLVEVRPALRTEELFVAAADLAGRGGRLRTLPSPVDLALFLDDFRREVAVPLLPAAAVRLIIAPLAWLGRSRGRDRRPRAVRARP